MIARPPLAVPLLGLAGFLVLLGLTIVDWAPLDRFDAAVSDAFRAYGAAHPRTIAVLRVVTDVAATVPYVLTGLSVSLALLARAARRAAACCALVTGLVPALWTLGHVLVHHPRPADGFVVVLGNGFPSGHTSNATAAGLVAVLLLWPGRSGRARLVTGSLAAGFALFIGLTRVALLAHWPTDVLGGWLLAVAVVPLVARGVLRAAPAPAPA